MPQIEAFYKDTWDGNVVTRVQQHGSRLRGTMMPQGIQGTAANRHWIRRYGKRSSFALLENRNESPAAVATGRDQRVFSYAKYGDREVFDDLDELKTQLAEPNGELLTGFIDDGERLYDDTLFTAFDATVITGGTISTSTAAYDSSMTVAVDFVESGSTANSDIGLGKIRQAKRLLDANEVPKNERYLAISAKQCNSLLRATELQSVDFYDKTIANGRLAMLYGFNLIESERIPTDGSSYRECFYWWKGAMKAGDTGYQTFIDENHPDYQHNTLVTVY
ncbi:MAG: phage capsid protein, partial [Candidatus Nanopelagicales bacterium]